MSKNRSVPPSPAPAPIPAPQPRMQPISIPDSTEVVVRMSIREAQVYLKGLGKLPLEESVEAYGKLKQQIEMQVKALAEVSMKQQKAEATPAPANDANPGKPN
jgi:hypothetical protein